MNTDEILLHLDVDGYCVIPSVIPKGDIDNVRSSVEATVATQSQGLMNGAEGVDSTKGLISFNQSFAPYLADNRLLKVTEALFGKHVRISFTTAIINNPGNSRGPWHSDWPFNQNNAGHIPSPYPDAVQHITTIWMLSPFNATTGGTLLVPGSHRSSNNPSGDNGVDPYKPYPTETQAVGDSGDVLIFDSRMWHATAENHTGESRVGMAVRWAPWWLNLDVLMPGSVERTRMVDESGSKDNSVLPVPVEVYEKLPGNVQPLFRHWTR